MAVIKLKNFLGKAPKINPESLPDTAAQKAINTKLYSGDIIPYPQPRFITSFSSCNAIKTLHGIRNPDDPSELNWLVWETDVDVVSASVYSDPHNRFFYSGDGPPKVSTYELAFSTNDPCHIGFYRLGLPVPGDDYTLSIDVPIGGGPGGPGAPGAPGGVGGSCNGTFVSQLAYLRGTNPNSDANDYFGQGIALSADGSTLAVGAYTKDSETGRVYIYHRHEDSWVFAGAPLGTHIDDHDWYGYALVFSDDGNTLAIGSPRKEHAKGMVHIFVRDTTTGAWSQQTFFRGSNTDESDGFGWSLAASSDGNILAIGAPFKNSQRGMVYIFTRDTTTGAWSQQTFFLGSDTIDNDNFGYAIALSADGSTLAVGAPNKDNHTGKVYIFAYDATNGWMEKTTLLGSDVHNNEYFGASIALSADGTILAASAPRKGGDQGVTYVFTYDSTNDSWSQTGFIETSNHEFGDVTGASVALSDDGTILVIGAPGEDSAATGIGGDPNNNSLPNSGAAYVFKYENGAWTQTTYIKASNPALNDQFGLSVAISGNGCILAVGAPNKDSATGGVYIFD